MGPEVENDDKNSKLFLKTTNCNACKNNNTNHSNECKKYRENMKSNVSFDDLENTNNKRIREGGSNNNDNKKLNKSKEKLNKLAKKDNRNEKRTLESSKNLLESKNKSTK